ncbi:uncharacterized protein LOC110719655 [Chenopodium quinoa]|uniref:uncharacterized protein LOC110719655 n=1 Tax=Chenopodium quinoa TaxID=63459 RepID=UPI000B77F66C|nr:uncharacterized protein LOC110719655 [Chenopodium quinoa]
MNKPHIVVPYCLINTLILSYPPYFLLNFLSKMEQKPQTQTQTNSQKNDQQKLPNLQKTNHNTNKKPIWDCGSTLYDSFELTSFQRQLDSAIINSSRTYSMPRLPSEHRRAPPPPPPSKKPITSKVSRSFQKLLRSVFRASKPNNNNSKPNYDSSSSSPDPWFLDHEVQEKDKVVDGGRYFVVYEKPNGLSSIPEVPEVCFSPEISSLVRKTMSDRFTAASTGIYCI